MINRIMYSAIGASPPGAEAVEVADDGRLSGGGGWSIDIELSIGEVGPTSTEGAAGAAPGAGVVDWVSGPVAPVLAKVETTGCCPAACKAALTDATTNGSGLHRPIAGIQTTGTWFGRPPPTGGLVVRVTVTASLSKGYKDRWVFGLAKVSSSH